ncbi:methionine--tRNA ligase, partial [Saccharothrix sp. MB29]|nr:methionine--tRNA ligase [Saccharothrix sp. MB29]
LAEVPRDLVRFFLALTAPEYQRTNFSRDALHAVTTRRLVEPWNELAEAVSLALVGVDASAPLRTTEDGRHRAAAMMERFRLCYELPNFSLGRAAETVITQLGRLRVLARSVDGRRNGHSPVSPGDLLLETRTLLACAAPILVDVADALLAEGVDLALASARPSRCPRSGSRRCPPPPRRPGSRPRSTAPDRRQPP